MSRAAKRDELLEKVGTKLREEERSEFNLDRWLSSYDDDVDGCALAIGEYVKSRRALALDTEEGLEEFYSRQDIQHYCQLFPQSKLGQDWVNELDNSIVFVEMGPREPSRTAKLIRTGQYLHAFFAWMEQMLRLVLRRERLTGRRSFAFCIFDMQNVSILQYANPMGPINRIFEMRVHLAMAFYAEMLSKVLIMNPPRLLGILFKIMSFILPSKIIGRFHIAHSAGEASQWIPLDAIPVGLGGNKTFEAGLLSNGCQPSGQFGKEHFLKNGTIFEENAVEQVNYEQVHVRSGHSFVRVLNASAGQKLLYEVWANRTFELFIQNEKGDYLLPNLRLCTPELAEEGEIGVEGEDSLIRVEVKNLAKLFGMRLRIGLHLI